MELLRVPNVCPRAPAVGSVQPSKSAVAVLIERALMVRIIDVSEELPALVDPFQHVPVPRDSHRLPRPPLRAVDVVPEESHLAVEVEVEAVLRGGRDLRNVRCDRFALSRRQRFHIARARHDPTDEKQQGEAREAHDARVHRRDLRRDFFCIFRFDFFLPLLTILRGA